MQPTVKTIELNIGPSHDKKRVRQASWHFLTSFGQLDVIEGPDLNGPHVSMNSVLKAMQYKKGALRALFFSLRLTFSILQWSVE
ncbi:MAG: hypothetical protein ACHP65_10460 [Legionellales bacterium]